MASDAVCAAAVVCCLSCVSNLMSWHPDPATDKQAAARVSKRWHALTAAL